MADRPIPFSPPMIRALLDDRKTQTRRILKPQPPKNEDFPGSFFGLGRKVADGVKWYSLNDYDRLPKHPTKWDLDGSVGVARDAGFPMEYDTRYALGDRLWVRESYYQRGHWEPVPTKRTRTGRQKWKFIPEGPVSFDRPAEFRKGRHHKDPATVAWHKRLGRFMPRKLSRLTLTITDVRVERLQDISEADAIAEGIEITTDFPADARRPLYKDYLAERTWLGNPVHSYHTLWNHLNGPGAWDANPWVVAISFSLAIHNIDMEAPSHG